MATLKTKLDSPKEDTKALVCDSTDWDNTTVVHLAKLLSDNLHTCIHDAIKQIIASGYTKEVAENTILRCARIYGMKDLVSSIVESALNCLTTEGCHDATLHTFRDLNSLVEYMMLEMVTCLREIKPSLSVLDAIWSLLICDLNVFDARGAKIDPHEKGVSTKAKSEPEPETKLEPPSNPGKSLDDECTCCEASCSEPEPEPKRATIRQKSLHDATSYNEKMTKLVLKAKPGMGSDLCFSFNASKPTTLKVETIPPEPPKTADYYLAEIPYDETEEKHLPQDEKDEMIIAAVDQRHLLQKEIKSWDDWANLKVMQVAKRLSQDRIELYNLKAEKAEAEQINKNKQDMKQRLSEIRLALNNSNSRISSSIAATFRLESENSIIKREKELNEKQSLITAKRLEEALHKEREALKKSESFSCEKNLLEDELKSLKNETGPKMRNLEKAKCLLEENETRLAKEHRETDKFLKQVETIRNERERLAALGKEENEKASAKAETEFRKYETEMKRIRYEIAAVNLEAKAKELAATRMGINCQPSDGTSTTKDSRKEFKHDRECVMCLSEEVTLVFVPCGHQVVCAECNLVHERSGMKDCPACRTPIQKRIKARFAKSKRRNNAKS